MLQQLDKDGFVIVPEILSEGEIVNMRTIFDAAADESGTQHVPLETGDARVAGTHDHPRVLELIRHILRREFAVQHLSGRNPLPGFGLQGLHTDWYTAGPPYVAATALFLLDAFTVTNGATRLVPGSHLLSTRLPKELQQPHAHHPHEIVVAAPAGAALVFNGHLWHGGTRNDSRGPRRALQCQWVMA